MIKLLLLVVGCFLAWSVGGEYRFGKGKRGFLLSIPLTLACLGYIAWYWLLAQIGLLYGIYQSLKYDPGIEMAYTNPDPVAKIIGHGIILANGALIGLTLAVIMVGRGVYWGIPLSCLISAIGFWIVAWLSNSPEMAGYRASLTEHGPQALPYTDDAGHKGFYINFKDAWWVSEGLMGAILGLIAWVALW